MALALVIKGADFSENKLDTVELENRVPCTGISIDKQILEFDAIGDTETIIATVTPLDTTDSVLWNSSDNNVASVANGVVTSVGIGEAVITATCGIYSVTCSVSVEVKLDYVVSGAFNARKATGGVLNGNVTTQAADSKYAIVARNSNDANIRTVDRNGGSQEELSSDFRFVPIPIPEGARRIKIESKFVVGSTTVGFKTRFLWLDSTQSETGYVGAKCLDGKSGENNWDQDNTATSVTYDIPTNLQGLDSFACSLYFADYVAKYNLDYADDVEVTFLTSAE